MQNLFYNSYQYKIFYAISGASQDSNLAVMLFILFINDLIGTIYRKKIAFVGDLKTVFIYHRSLAMMEQ